MVATQKVLTIHPSSEDLAADDARQEGLRHQRVVESHGLAVVAASLGHAVDARRAAPGVVRSSRVQFRVRGGVVLVEGVCGGGMGDGVQVAVGVDHVGRLQELGEPIAFVDCESGLRGSEEVGGRVEELESRTQG
jgi:hypothetical protein